MIIREKINPYQYPNDRLFSDSTEQKIKQLESDFEELNDKLNRFDVSSVLAENEIKEENDKKLQDLKNEVHHRIDTLQNLMDCGGSLLVEEKINEKISKQEKLVKLALISRFI
jgi:DNA anti-recombination protein RmuC